MDNLKKNLEQREKPELMTPLSTTSARKSSLDPEVYRQQEVHIAVLPLPLYNSN